MDEIVKAALRKWPNVPHCHDWLGLDARGEWFLRDEATQRAGLFPQPKGSRIVHDKLREFIGRNYEADAEGAWFFQNGPQRVYVALEAAPWVLGVRREEDGSGYAVETHTGRPVGRVERALLDEQGRLFLDTDLGLGVVRSPDMVVASDALERLGWPLDEVKFDTLPGRFGYCLRPEPKQAAGSATPAGAPATQAP